ncbi:hypothetical protein BRY73_08475 [Ochrobactrum sp. P6BS-III]|uniref:DNA-binding protein n=1 Tax=unclassified Ochrobactrum TaxID=239106 RepID=UPI0009CABE81|nr:putative DNA-binding transcriptional regulator AlpA [Ochrobactrum sp. P6BSIII]OOL18082.1 hypothetical protein BRY73_08475 [Ochrobactrum sp. P6BS-III]
MSTIRYMTGPQVLARYGVTPNTLCRWQRDTSLGFPKPLKINRRNYWAPEDLDAFDEQKRSPSK